MKYRRKSIIVEAVKWTGDAGLANSFIGERYSVDWEFSNKGGGGSITIPGMNGVRTARVNDYIVKDAKGKIDVCNLAFFEQNYERLDG